jgi:hypothetical protein
MMRASLRQIDEDDIRVVTQTVEDDFLAIGRDVERPRPHRAAIAEAGERAGLLRCEIEQPEIPRLRAGHVHETRSIGQETMATAHGGPHVRQFDPGTIRFHSEQWDSAAYDRASVHNQGAIRRPHWIDHLTRYEAHGCAPIYRDLEQPCSLHIDAGRHKPRATTMTSMRSLKREGSLGSSEACTFATRSRLVIARGRASRIGFWSIT